MRTGRGVGAWLRAVVRPSGSDVLILRMRWLFLALMALVFLLSVIGTATSPASMPSRSLAVLALLTWLAWGFVRYHRPHAHVATDVVPLAAMAVLGLASGAVASTFGPAFIWLFYRAMFGSRREVVGNALAQFLVYELLWLLTPVGSGPVDPVGTALLLVSFVGFGLGVQAVGAAVRRHDVIVRCERVLTGLSNQFLAALAPEEVHQIAVDGALELVEAHHGESLPSATLWLGEDELGLVASAGPDRADHEHVAPASAPPSVFARFQEGGPFLLEREAVVEIQRAYEQSDLFTELMAAPLTRDGAPVGALVIVAESALPRDLVGLLGRFANEIVMAMDRTTLLGDLREANLRLREASAAKDEFVSTVSHELRTPLTSIRGFTMTLRQHWRDLGDDERERMLEVIDRQSRTQQRLIEDLLTTSRAMADQLPVHPQVVDAGVVLDDVLQVLELDPDHVVVAADPDCTVVVDPHHLQQTLSNLLSNAHKYGAPPYVVELRRDGDEVVIAVADHGPGVHAEFRPRIFEPFTQAETGDTRTSRGVGLGLSIVQRLLAVNRGSITLVAEGPTSGACFVVRLPAAPRVVGEELPPARADTDHVPAPTVQR